MREDRRGKTVEKDERRGTGGEKREKREERHKHDQDERLENYNQQTQIVWAQGNVNGCLFDGRCAEGEAQFERREKRKESRKNREGRREKREERWEKRETSKGYTSVRRFFTSRHNGALKPGCRKMYLANALQNAVYHCMEVADPRQRYRNKMQLTHHENSALLEREGHQSVSLHVDWIDESTLSIDWSPANERWGRSKRRGGIVAGSAGLIENTEKCWKLHVALHAEEVTPASSGRGYRLQDCMSASESVLSSHLLQCRKCLSPECEFRAPTGWDHCCLYCKAADFIGAGVASLQQQHDWPRWPRGDDRCVWYRVYPLKEWGLVTWMLVHTVAPVLRCEDTRQALQAPAQLDDTSCTAHEVFLVRAARALQKYCITSSAAPTDISSGEHMPELRTESHSADMAGVSAVVVSAEVSDQTTSLPDAAQRTPEASACGSALAEAEGLDVSVAAKTCPQ